MLRHVAFLYDGGSLSAMFPRYFRNRIGFAPTTDGKIIFLLRFDGPRDGWTMFTDGTQRRLSDGYVEEWCYQDPAQTIEEVPCEEAERLVAQNRA